MRARLIQLSIVAALCGGITAAPQTHPKAPEKIRIWVGHTFIGGPKCVHAGPVHNFEPPGFAAEKEKLRRVGVLPEREYFRDLATCEACQRCANYRREILFEILHEQLETANKQGYHKVTSPTNAELNEYEEGKRFRAKPDGAPRDD